MKPDDCSFAAAAASAGHKRSLALTLVTQSNTGRTLHLVIVRRRTEKSISVKEMVCRVIYTRPESLLLQQEPPSSTSQHNPDHHRPARLADRYAKPETAAAAVVVVVVG